MRKTDDSHSGTECGSQQREQFLFAPGYLPLNHGRSSLIFSPKCMHARGEFA